MGVGLRFQRPNEEAHGADLPVDKVDWGALCGGQAGLTAVPPSGLHQPSPGRWCSLLSSPSCPVPTPLFLALAALA